MKLCNYVRLMIVLAFMGLAAQVQAAQVYLDVPDTYNVSNPSWHVWTWADGQSGYWVSGTVLSNGLIEFTVNENNLQFVRKSPDGNTEWNRTVNLNTVADATYEITGWGDNSGMTVNVTNPTYNTVYLDPSAVTESGNVWYAWSFATGGNGSWVAGTLSGDKYEFEVANLKDQIIFVRMNANGAPSWDSSIKLNQTEDLDVQIDGTYVITSLGNEKMVGYWESQSSDGKPIWHQDANGDPNYYLANRRALVGRHCVVNKLINVVGVGSWITDLNNLVDEDLNNYATFPKIADVGVGVNPVTSVRDTKNHYAAGTRAGFNLVMAADASLLSVDLANCFAISFYLEGELQQTVPLNLTDGQSFGGIGLSLITLPGSTEVSIDVVAEAPCEFDEISLMPAGVNVEVASTARLRYAFVGDLITHTITETSMQNYAAEHGRLPFSLDQGAQQREGRTNGIETGYWVGSDLINDDLTDGVVWGVIGIGSSMEARVGAAINRQDPDQSQPFKAGSIVGFCYGNGSILNLPLGDAIRIRLYRGEWVQQHSAIYGDYYEYVQTEVQDESVKINVLSVNVIKGGNYQVTIKANQDFSHARISFPTGLTLNLGGNKVKYAFICDPPEGFHKCDLEISADVALCADDTQYQLTANGGIPVTWTLIESPAGSNATVDANTGLLSGIDIEGEYIVRATAQDGCYDEVIVTSGLDIETRCDMPIANYDETEYVLSDEVMDDGGALININGYLINKDNVLNTNYNDYATFNSVLDLTLVENLPIVGVKKLDGNISNGTKRRVGFVVETKSTGLSADALDLFNIRCYKNGQRTYWHVIDETNVVKAKVIGSDKMQKLRYSITVPADVEFDEFVLWKSGVLDLELERFKVYYAFDEDAEGENALNDCGDPLGCAGHMISNDENATLNSNEIQFAGAINAANVADNLYYLVDDDINTGVSVTNTISLGNGIVFAIDLGRVYSPKHQIGIVLDEKTYLAQAKVGGWLTIKTYLNGVETGDQQSDWSVVGLNVIGYGDKSFLYLNPTMPYDEVRITVAAIGKLLDFDTKYFGIFVRSDYDGDGTPDCQDDYICPNPLGVDVRYESAFSAAEMTNIYKNHVLIYNVDSNPVMIEQMPVGSEIRVKRVDDDFTIATIRVTDVTANADGTYTLTYTNTPGQDQNHVDGSLYPESQGTFVADEWGYIDFLNLYVTDQFSASTLNNTQPDEHHYMAQLVNEQRMQETESRTLMVPVTKTMHEVNAATYTQNDVDTDTLHLLSPIAPVDMYVQMENDPRMQKYAAFRNPQTSPTEVAYAERVGDTNEFNFMSMNENGQMQLWNTTVMGANEVRTVVLRDNSLMGIDGYNYVPVISIYTDSYNNNKDTTVLSTYGANLLTDVMPTLALHVRPVLKSYPFSGYMSYTADIDLIGNVPEDMTAYRFRLWRVMPDGTEEMLDTLKTETGGSGESFWYTNYDALKDTYPTSSITVRDIFITKAIDEGQTLEVNYIGRLYAETDLPTLNRDGKGYGLAPAGAPGEWGDNTPTALYEIGNTRTPVNISYFNPLGMASSKPFDGLNIIVITYSDGTSVVQKRVFD